MRKSADRVRIAVALIKAGDGANVWSETYDRELKDIFAVQSEIAGAVAKELKVALLGNNGQTAQLATAATPSNQNVEAYNALLQGNFYFNRRTAEDMRKAIGYYEEAIRLDPRYALAYAKLSVAAVNLASSYGSLATKKEKRRSQRPAPRRRGRSSWIRISPMRIRHKARSCELVDFNFAAAEAEYRRALELAPQNPAVTANLALLLPHLAGSTKRSHSCSGRLRSSRYAADPTPTSRSISPRSAATTRPRRRCARPSSCSRSPLRTICVWR